VRGPKRSTIRTLIAWLTCCLVEWPVRPAFGGGSSSEPAKLLAKGGLASTMRVSSPLACLIAGTFSIWRGILRVSGTSPISIKAAPPCCQ
jgi:hypothetical protein